MNFCLQPKSKLKFLVTSSPNIFGNWKYIHPWKHRRSRKCMQRFAKKNGKTFYLFQLTSGSWCCKKDSQAINYFKLCIARLGVLSCVLNIDFATSKRVCLFRGQKLLPTANTEWDFIHLPNKRNSLILLAHGEESISEKKSREMKTSGKNESICMQSIWKKMPFPFLVIRVK